MTSYDPNRELDTAVGDGGLYSQSECGHFPAPSDSSCYIPWMRPNLRWYYDAATGTCLPFEYGGCGGEPNQFATFDECMGSCFAGQSCQEMGGCGAQEELSSAGLTNGIQVQEETAAVWPLVCEDGSILNPELRCDGFFDCSSGEDEANCGDINSYDYYGYDGPTGNIQPPSVMMPEPDFSRSADGVVLDLNSRNFDSAVASHDRILVNFFAPWCQTCIDFKRKFEEAALEEPVKNMGVRFAKVDMEKETLLRERFQVNEEAR